MSCCLFQVPVHMTKVAIWNLILTNGRQSLLAARDTLIYIQLKPNSWTYNFIEVSGVSGHNLKSSQTWGILQNVNITNQFRTTSAREGGGGRKEENRIVEVTVNSKEENSSDFWPNYVQEFGLRLRFTNTKCGNRTVLCPEKDCTSSLSLAIVPSPPPKKKKFVNHILVRLNFSINILLKVVGNEKNGGPGRRQMLRYGAGPWRWMFNYNLNMQF